MSPGLRRVHAPAVTPFATLCSRTPPRVAKGTRVHHQPLSITHGRGRPPVGRAALVAVTVVLALATTATAAPPSPTARADTGGWQTATPAEVGMDAATLNGACDYALQPERHTQGVVVIRGGKLVDECYAPGEGPRSWAASWSVAKSYASTLIGIAIDQGKIPGLDVSMADYFPDWAGTPKAAITLRDVVTMSSGLQWREDYSPTDALDSDVIKMGLAADELAYAASRPLVHTPGTVWNYSSGDAMLLSGVIAKATGMSAGDYAQRVLFDPLGMTQVEWWTDAAGHTLTYCCNDMTSRDFARLGLLFLNNGVWNGNQIVSAQWVHDAFEPVPDSNGAYGYMWWLTHADGVDGPIAMANGFDGQMIFIIPSLDLVVVRNGDYVKSACPPVGDPNLFTRYPPSGLIPGQGTRPPENWSNADFLAPIVASVTGDPPASDVYPAAEPTPSERFPDGQTTAPCATEGTSTTTSTPPPASTTTVPAGTSGHARPATPISAQPRFTG